MTIGTELHADHERLDALFQDVIEASEADVSTDVLGASWTRFEDAVRAHFEAEETHLFPRMAKTHPEDVARLREEHAEILRLLLALDLQVDLHLIRHPTVVDAMARLRAHAASEDATVYAWADALPAEHRRPLIAAVRELLNPKR